MKARTGHLKSHIYARRRQGYKVCMTRHFRSYRKKERNMQVKRLQRGGWMMKWKYKQCWDKSVTVNETDTETVDFKGKSRRAAEPCIEDSGKQMVYKTQSDMWPTAMIHRKNTSTGTGWKSFALLAQRKQLQRASAERGLRKWKDVLSILAADALQAVLKAKRVY